MLHTSKQQYFFQTADELKPPPTPDTPKTNSLYFEACESSFTQARKQTLHL